MNQQQRAMVQQVLGLIANSVQTEHALEYCKAIAGEALRQLLEQPEPVQEPVAWMHVDAYQPSNRHLEWKENCKGYEGDWIKHPLYTTPPAQPTGDKLTPVEAQPADHIRDATKMGATAEESSGVEPRKHYQWDDGMRLLSDIAPQHKGNV